MLRKVVWLRIGGRQLHLLKAAGAFFIVASVLKLSQALYELLQQVDVVKVLLQRGWLMGPHSIVLPFKPEDAIGILLGPFAVFLFWVGVAFVALMIYQSGKVIFPLEEFEQRIVEHHQNLIRRAVEHHKKKK